jgi:hypothetical protein
MCKVRWYTSRRPPPHMLQWLGWRRGWGAIDEMGGAGLWCSTPGQRALGLSTEAQHGGCLLCAASCNVHDSVHKLPLQCSVAQHESA